MDRKMFDMSEFYRDSGNMRNAPDFTTKKVCTSNEDSDDYCIMADNADCGCTLAMAFVNMQPLDSVYPTAEAFCNGTLFPNLNKPFFGGRRK